jgi:hypothetical protein
VDVKELRRGSLDLWLKYVRFPLTLTETVVRRSVDTETWPPAMAFASFEGNIKEMVGRLTHDDTLVELANLQRAEITQRQRAVALDAEATSTAAETRRDADADRARLERQRQDAEARSREAARQMEMERENAKRALEHKTATKRTASRTAAATRAKTIDKAATKADADRLRKQGQALQAKKQAVAAQAEVTKLDNAVQAKKATRRAN